MAGLATALTLLPTLLGACSTAESPAASGLPEVVQGFLDQSHGTSGGTYRTPDEGALRDVPRAVLASAAGRRRQAEVLLARHGYRIDGQGVGRRLVLGPERVPDGRGWGLYAVLPAGRPVAVEVPHPRDDRHTDVLGASLAERVRAEHVLLAGARRDRADDDADVAHREASMFAAVHAALAREGVPALQLHGFAEESAPDYDVVVSTGRAARSRLGERLASALDDAGFSVCRAWHRDCGSLEGTTNVQGAASAASAAPFVHLEVSRPVRDDVLRRAVLLDALTAAVVAAVPLPAQT